MPQINYDKDIAASNSLIKISRSTGIDNFSRTSKTKAISEIVSEDVSTYIDISNDIVNNMYSASAEGRYLDLKGSEYGAYRNTVDSIDIKATDLVIRVEPRDEDQTFLDIFGTNRTIYKFEEIELGSNFKLIITESVQIGPQTVEVFLSGRIESIDRESGFQANANDVFKMPESMQDISFEAPSLQIKFEKPISLEVGSEDDAAFRQRVIFARDNAKFGVAGAIQRSLIDIPGISGFSIYIGERGPGTIDVGIVTAQLEAGEEDPSAESMKSLVEYRLRSVVAEGISYELFIPQELQLNVEFSFTSTVAIPDTTIIDAIYSAIKNINTYSNENTITASDIEDEAERIINSVAVIDITTLSLLDIQIEEFITFGSTFAIAPKGMFISINKNDIVKA